MKRPRRYGFRVILLHAALIVIAVGACLTAFTGRTGSVRLREGAGPAATWRTAGGEVRTLPFLLRLDSLGADGSRLTVISGSNSACLHVGVSQPACTDGLMLTQGVYDGGAGVSVVLVADDSAGTATVMCGYALLLGFLCAILWRRRRLLRRPAMIWTLAAALLITMAAGLWFWHTNLMLRSPLLWVHMFFVAWAYLLFALLFVGAVRERADTRLLLPAVACLTAGIVLGSVWGQMAWGRYWGWDPKETMALLTWALYLVPLHMARRPRTVRLMLILAFLAVIVTSVAVNTGLHAYI